MHWFRAQLYQLLLHLASLSLHDVSALIIHNSNSDSWHLKRKIGSATTMNTETKNQHEQTQAIIQQLYNASKSEYMTPSTGDAYAVSRDPHLRLRRTLTPSLNVGIPKYAEAQFMLSKEETSGKRISLEFGVEFDGNMRYFTMDAYAFGSSEADADVRIVTLHGISSGVSRTRWHSLGKRYNETNRSSNKKVRFIALDWHSIDRSVDDSCNAEFLTCLPKHIMDISSDDVEEFAQLFSTQEKQDWYRNFAKAMQHGVCPRTYDDGARVLHAVIEQGLGWGKTNTPFVLGIKSWSGGLGMRLLAQLYRSNTPEDTVFASHIHGVIIMHAGCFNKKDIADAMALGKASLMCWAKDDPLVPYPVTQLYLDAASSSGNDHLKLCAYEIGGHHNFDGSDNLPNFDDEVIQWIDKM